ncbi:MAG: nitrilase-related carbon-nitrogen hydrolase [Thermodesulfobacteriota bacterium]
MQSDIRIVTVICPGIIGQTSANLERLKSRAAEAKACGAALVCFPELNLTGYHVRAPIAEAAEPIDGPVVEAVQKAAATHRIAIIAGMAERETAAESKTLYATQFVVNAAGELVCHYRKAHLGPPEKQLFTPGDQIPPLVTINGFTFGIQLCYDAHFPEMTTQMALAGADAIFIPHASPHQSAKKKRDSWMRHLPARAYDNGLFVAAVNPVGDNGCGLLFPGVSLVLSPSGEVLTSHTVDTETICITDLSAQTLADVRSSRMRYFLPNRRPELYRPQT